MKVYLKLSVFALILFMARSLAFAGSVTSIPFTDPYRDGYVLALWNAQYSDTELDEIMKTLIASGSPHVSILVLGCQATSVSTEIGACEFRPYSDYMKFVDKAMEHNLDVAILPFVGSMDGIWRGQFQPTNVADWFKSYTAWISKVAADAEKRNLKELIIGTEYSTLQKYGAEWRKVIAAVRKIYSGPLIYTANWDSLNIDFWDAVDAVGVSAYFSLSTNPNPSQKAELDSAWLVKKKLLMDLSIKTGKPIHITEVGYTNSDSAAATPYYTPKTAKRDDALQVRCFEAFRKSWQSEKNLVRANVWAANGPGMPYGEISGDPLGHPAQDILAAFFQERLKLDGGKKMKLKPHRH